MIRTLLAIALVLTFAVPVFAQGPFNDVPTDHWAYQAVNELQKKGIVIGYPDGTFGGKRQMTRYEFAVAIARLLPMIPEEMKGPDGTPVKTDISNLATKDDVAALRKLVDEFQAELASLGVDLDAAKKDIAALSTRVDAIEAELERVKIYGEFNAFAIGSENRDGAQLGFSTPYSASDIDGRIITPTDTLGRTAAVVHDFDIHVVGKVSDNVKAKAVINYGNYLNYIQYVDSYVGGIRPSSLSGYDQVYLYYAMAEAKLSDSVTLTVGRMPLQLTPYTMKKIDVDTYTSILKTDDGNYPVDGGSLALKLGGLDLTLFAAKHDNNPFLQYGLAGQIGSRITHDAGGAALGGLNQPIAQSAGLHAAIPIMGTGKIGATYYQGWSKTAWASVLNYDQARVYGIDLNLPFASTWALKAEWARTDTLNRKGNNVADIDNKNNAIDAMVEGKISNIGVGVGYKSIERNFASAGAWDVIGGWTNPTNLNGFYATLDIPFGEAFKLMAKGQFLEAIDTVSGANMVKDDKLTHAYGAVAWNFSPKNKFDVSYEYVKYDPTTYGLRNIEEEYLTFGIGHKMSDNANLKVGYQLIDYKGSTAARDYKAGVGVVQLGVSF